MMHSHLGKVLAAAVLMVLLAEVPTGTADCCGTWYEFNEFNNVARCADCYRPGAHNHGTYCGAEGGGGCNLFGCNCGGGCRQPVEGRTCSATCCDRHDRHDRRSRREVVSAAISMPKGNYTGHDVIIAGDLDKNGHLDEVEVHVYLTQRGVFANDVTAWRKLDADADGKLTAAEIDDNLRIVNAITGV